MRRRVCNGKNCLGCNQEWRACNSEPCRERVEELITDWQVVESSKESQQRIEKRLKFACKFDSYLESNNMDPLELNATVDYRICSDDDNKLCRSMSKPTE